MNTFIEKTSSKESKNFLKISNRDRNRERERERERECVCVSGLGWAVRSFHCCTIRNRECMHLMCVCVWFRPALAAPGILTFPWRKHTLTHTHTHTIISLGGCKVYREPIHFLQLHPVLIIIAFLSFQFESKCVCLLKNRQKDEHQMNTKQLKYIMHSYYIVLEGGTWGIKTKV